MTQRRIMKKDISVWRDHTNGIKKNSDIKMIIGKMAMMGKGETTFIKLFPEGKRRTNGQNT